MGSGGAEGLFQLLAEWAGTDAVPDDAEENQKGADHEEEISQPLPLIEPSLS
jgi:hypothetical protein